MRIIFLLCAFILISSVSALTYHGADGFRLCVYDVNNSVTCLNNDDSMNMSNLSYHYVLSFDEYDTDYYDDSNDSTLGIFGLLVVLLLIAALYVGANLVKI